MKMRRMIFILFSPNEQRGVVRGALPDVLFSLVCSLFPVQQTTSQAGLASVWSHFYGLATQTTLDGIDASRRTKTGGVSALVSSVKSKE